MTFSEAVRESIITGNPFSRSFWSPYFIREVADKGLYWYNAEEDELACAIRLDDLLLDDYYMVDKVTFKKLDIE